MYVNATKPLTLEQSISSYMTLSKLKDLLRDEAYQPVQHYL
jgi:hypothetical protein